MWIVLATLSVWATGCQFSPRSERESPELARHSAAGSSSGFSFASYASVLRNQVDGEGRVDYQGLKIQRQELDTFVAALTQLSPTEYEGWKETQQIAFWINAYNALTLLAIVERYPIESLLLVSPEVPQNSILQIPGVWDKLRFTVMGQALTLDEIEHEILRKKFNEPRIHMALVCAAVSCPPLRNEPYVAASLSAQLDDQARNFFSSSLNFHIDRPRARVWLSSLFKWYGSDFVKTYGSNDRFASHDEAERAVLNFACRFLSSADREYLLNASYRIEYLGYDWSLNEQPRLPRISSQDRKFLRARSASEGSATFGCPGARSNCVGKLRGLSPTHNSTKPLLVRRIFASLWP